MVRTAMKVHVLCSDPQHPAYPRLYAWCLHNGALMFSRKQDLSGGDLLFLISCTEVLNGELANYAHVIVIHESDLPRGRGWSPLAWQVLEGRNRITVSMIEAAERVDAGRIIRQEVLELDGTELAREIHAKCAEVKARLMDWALDNPLEGVEQEGVVSYYPRRSPKDSRIDPNRPLAEQFDLLRICDQRFPAFFDLRGARYEISLRKIP